MGLSSYLIKVNVGKLNDQEMVQLEINSHSKNPRWEKQLGTYTKKIYCKPGEQLLMFSNLIY